MNLPYFFLHLDNFISIWRICHVSYGIQQNCQSIILTNYCNVIFSTFGEFYLKYLRTNISISPVCFHILYK